MILKALILLVCMLRLQQCNADCDNEVYCKGRLLHEVQMQHVYADCKTFVDMRMKVPYDEIMSDFQGLLNSSNNLLSRSKVENFVRDHFDRIASEFENWTPTDWTGEPNFLRKLIDPNLKDLGNKLNAMWKYLGRKISDDVRLNADRYSMIYVPNPLIVPGGRFREFYYWDSYWIMRGLLLCEMYETVKGMLLNYLHMVHQYGLVPNGGRVYYIGRSQPPLLIPMVNDYMEFTNDMDFLQKNLAGLEEEFSFWLTKRTVKIQLNGHSYTLLRFDDQTQGPRPESYREDVMTAKAFNNNDDKENFYKEMKAAAESGRDFTSRWFIHEGTNKGNITSTKTRSIIPVDLNGMMEWNARLLSEFCAALGHKNKAAYYKKLSKEFLHAIEMVLWHEDVGAWLDYDISNNVRRDYFYPTNLSPLWTGSYDKNNVEHYVTRVLKYLDNSDVLKYPGGVPSSDYETGEQWDFPNTWSPHQDMIITGLYWSGDPRALGVSKTMAHQWVYVNYRAFRDAKSMFEKYDSTSDGAPGGGGEYDLQIGFGWTNGFFLDLLDRYGDQLMVPRGATSMVQRPRLQTRYKLISAIVIIGTILRCI